MAEAHSSHRPSARQGKGSKQSTRLKGVLAYGRQSRNCTEELVQRKITWALHSTGKGFFSVIHQYQFLSARALHSSKCFQISQSHSARDQNEQVLWFINCDLKSFYSPYLLGVFVGMGRRQKTAIYKLVGLKVSHSTQWPLNTLLFRRDPWKGRNTPAGVTDGSTSGTVNPNKLVRVTSRYLRPLSPEQRDEENSSWNANMVGETKASAGWRRLVLGKPPSYKLCWKHLGSIWFFTL